MKKILRIINTVKYLNLSQLIYQVIHKISKKNVRKNLHYCKEYRSINLFIKELDMDENYLKRMNTDALFEDYIEILHKKDNFNMQKWCFPENTHLWNYNLHYLEFCVPLVSMYKITNNDKYIIKLNSIIDSWLNKGILENDDYEPYTISLRIVNLLIVSEYIYDDLKHKMYNQIYNDYQYLLQHQEKHLLCNHYLENLKAIVICSVIFDDDKYNKYLKKLLKQLSIQILSNGLHYELSIMYHKIILEDLLRIEKVLSIYRKNDVSLILPYIYKMTDCLYSIEHGTGRTPLFNDSGDNVSKNKNSIIKYVCSHYNHVINMSNSIDGYYKLYENNITILIDCATIGPENNPGHSHCDCLSFELYFNQEPVFVNSGTYNYQSYKRNYFRSTKAHNTIVMGELEQSECWGEHRVARRIRNVKGYLGNHTFFGSYKNYKGYKHEREFSLVNYSLSVIDRTISKGVVRSYLHLAPGYDFVNNSLLKSNEIVGKFTLVNCELTVEDYDYSPEFGIIIQCKCLLFSWVSDNENHGYTFNLNKERFI